MLQLLQLLQMLLLGVRVLPLGLRTVGVAQIAFIIFLFSSIWPLLHRLLAANVSRRFVARVW